MPAIQREKTSILSVSLPKNFRKRVISYALKNDIATSQLVKEALKSYLFKEEWNKIARPFRKAGMALGLDSDEKVEAFFSKRSK